MRRYSISRVKWRAPDTIRRCDLYLQVNLVGQKQLMIPFQVDPSWYEKYWWREPAPRRLSAFALLRRGLERFKKIQGSNVMTHAVAHRSLHNRRKGVSLIS